MLVPVIDASYDQAAQAFEAAFMLDPSRDEIRSRLAGLQYEHLLFAEDFRLDSKAQVLAERLAVVDVDGSRRRALAAPGTLILRTTPVASRAVLERYERDEATGRQNAKVIGPIDASSSARSLPPGSYRLLLDGPGLAHVVYPFELGRGERLDLSLTLPAATSIPDGFVYVPPGESWFGDADEQLRTQFLDTVPMHRRRLGRYLIAKHETTYGEWVEFLDALPAAERGRRAPDVSTAARGSLRLHGGPGEWQLTFRPSTQRYSARMGEPIVYEGRKKQSPPGLAPLSGHRHLPGGRGPIPRLAEELGTPPGRPALQRGRVGARGPRRRPAACFPTATISSRRTPTSM